MERIFGLIQGMGVAVLFAVAGLSDAGRLGLGATAAWAAAGVVAICAAMAGSRLAAGRRRVAARRAEVAEGASPVRTEGGKVIPFPPLGHEAAAEAPASAGTVR